MGHARGLIEAETNVLKFLSRTPVLIFMLAAFLLIGYSFAWVQAGIGEGPLLDMINSGVEARDRIAAMTDAQRARHLFGTLVNDMVYPLAYGGLLAGLAFRFGGGRGRLLAIPAIATVIVDVTENIVQALALTGTADVLAAKDLLTPLKFGLFILAAMIALGVIIWAVIGRVTKKI